MGPLNKMVGNLFLQIFTRSVLTLRRIGTKRSLLCLCQLFNEPLILLVDMLLNEDLRIYLKFY